MDRNPSFARRCLMSVVVALRKESVDRNASSGVDFAEDWLSLSARRAWIEIFVAITFSGFSNGRSPQGERG